MSTKISKQNVQDIFELSLVQKGMLFGHLQDDKSSVYNIQLVFDIEGNLNINLLERAINEVVSKNEVLRSVFTWEIIDKPLQIILKSIRPSITVLDLTHQNQTNRNAFFDSYLDNDKQSRFDLTSTPIRFGIIKFSEVHYKLHITHHHILYDGWSTGILLKELFSFYNCFTEDNTPLEFKKTSYKDVQKDIKNKLETYDGTAYWKDYLFEYNINNLSVEKSLINNSGNLQKISVSFNSDIASYATRNKVTKAAIIYSAYGLLLHKYLFTSDIVFGTTVSCREASEKNSEDVIGNFINTIPFRLSEVEDKTLKEIVLSTHQNLIKRNSYHNTSYFEIKQLIGLSHHNELFDSVVVIENYPVDKNILNYNEDCEIKLDSVYENAGIPLHITVYTEDTLKIELVFDTSKFSDEIIRKLSVHFEVIIDEILNNSNKQPRDININSTEEVDHLLKLNPSPVSYPDNKNIIELFESCVQTNPNKIAVFDDKESYTYRSLNNKINQLANFLIDKDVNKGDVVGILMDRSVDFITCVFAILKVGGSYLPLPIDYPNDRLNYMLKDSGTSFVLCNRSVIEKKEIEIPCRYHYYQEDQDLVTYSTDNLKTQILEDIYIIYTSGSTGTPKGVKGSHIGLLNRLYWAWDEYPIKEEEIHCFKTNIGFVDHVVEVFLPLLSGIPLRVCSEEEILDVSKMYNVLVKDKVSRLTVVPTYLTSILEIKKSIGARKNQLSLQYVFSSGEYLPFQLAKEFYQEFPDTLLVNIYGSTEVGADATYYNVERYYVEDILRYFTDQNTPIDYFENSDFENCITRPNVEILELTNKFKNYKIPDYPSSPQEYYSNFKKSILPYSINTASPKFIGHMTSVLPNYVHDMSKLISQLNQNLVKIETSKSLTFMEREAIAMLHRIFYSFPDGFYSEHIQRLNSNLGIVTSGGSTANISALLNARNKLLFDNDNTNESVYQIIQQKGYNDLVILGSRLMHYSIDKAASLLGLGTKNIIHLKDTVDGTLDLDDLKNKINYCKDQKLLIVALVGIAGSTETGRIDPLKEMGEIARNNNIHFHVDAAWGGLLKFSDKYDHLIDGIELADSITFCGHKQLFLPQGISVCLFKDPSRLSYNATQARYQATADSFDFGRYTPNGSRSALSLCLHGALNIFGKKGYGLLMEKGIELAKVFERIIVNTEGFELISSHINIINYRYIPIRYRNNKSLNSKEIEDINEINLKIQKAQFFKGKTFVSKTRVTYKEKDCVVFRVVLSNPLTKLEDLESVITDQFNIIEELYDEKNILSLKYDNIIDQKYHHKIELDEPEIRTIPIGVPISNTEITILNKHDQLQVEGFIGEICISGHGLASGYASKISTFDYALINGKQFYRTGDLGRWMSDGRIDFLGRSDLQVKLRGQRIELSEIEASLTNHTEIQSSAVLVKGRYSSGNLIAYYQSKKELKVSELMEFLADKLPPYMIPVDYIWLEKMPMMPNGKVDRKSLPDDVLISGINFIEPESKTEKELSTIWMKILELDDNFFGVNTSFFKVGGHSLNAIVLVNEIQRKYNVEVSIRDVFFRNTISSLSELIDTKVWVLSGCESDGNANDKVFI